MKLNIIKIIKDLSFIFGFLGFFLSIFVKDTGINELIFLWFLLISIVSYVLRGRNIFPYTIFLLLLPLLFLKNPFDYVVVIFLFLFVFRNYGIKTFKLRYGKIEEEFKRSLFIIIFTVFVSFILIYIYKLPINIDELMLPYYILSLISSIYLLRTLRFLEYNKEEKEIEKLNLRDLLITIGIAVFLSFPMIRSLLFKLIYYIYLGIGYAIAAFAVILLFPIGLLIRALLRIFSSFLSERGIYSAGEQRFLQNWNIKNTMRILNPRESRDVFAFLENPTTLKILVSILILLAFIIIYRLIRSYSFSTERDREEYEEEKEFVLPKLENPLKKIFRRITDKERIREYYKKYLMASKENGIILEPSDTSLDVYQKTLGIFNVDLLRRIREIYIRARYSHYDIDKKSVKEFIDMIKKII